MSDVKILYRVSWGEIEEYIGHEMMLSHFVECDSLKEAKQFNAGLEARKQDGRISRIQVYDAERGQDIDIIYRVSYKGIRSRNLMVSDFKNLSDAKKDAKIAKDQDMHDISIVRLESYKF